VGAYSPPNFFTASPTARPGSSTVPSAAPSLAPAVERPPASPSASPSGRPRFATVFPARRARPRLQPPSRHAPLWLHRTPPAPSQSPADVARASSALRPLPSPPGFTPLLLPLEGQCGLACRFLVVRARRLLLWLRPDFSRCVFQPVVGQVGRQVCMLPERPIRSYGTPKNDTGRPHRRRFPSRRPDGRGCCPRPKLARLPSSRAPLSPDRRSRATLQRT
jgi:hypothetical protein